MDQFGLALEKVWNFEILCLGNLFQTNDKQSRLSHLPSVTWHYSAKISHILETHYKKALLWKTT